MRVGAVVLAGGRATRMGGNDKGLLLLNGKPLVRCCLDKLADADRCCISANRNRAEYEANGVTVCADVVQGFTGPLAGIHAALCAMGDEVDAVVSVPCDSPFFPSTLFNDLVEALKAHPESRCVAVKAGGNYEPGFAIYRTQMRDELKVYLENDGRRVRQFLQMQNVYWLEYADAEPFRNLNTPEELEEVQGHPTN